MKGHRTLALGMAIALLAVACSARAVDSPQETSSTKPEAAGTGISEGTTQTTFDAPSPPESSTAPTRQPDFPAVDEVLAELEPSEGEYFQVFAAPGAIEIERFESFFALVASAGLIVTGRITDGRVAHFIEGNDDTGGPIWYIDLTLDVGRVLGGYDAHLFKSGDSIVLTAVRFSQDSADELVGRESEPALLVLRRVGEVVPAFALSQGRDIKATGYVNEWQKDRYVIVSSQGVFTMRADGSAYAPALEAAYETLASRGEDDFVDPVMLEARSTRFDQLVGLAIDYWSCRYTEATPVEWTEIALAKCAGISYQP